MPRGQKVSNLLVTSSKILVANTQFLVALATSQSQFWTLITDIYITTSYLLLSKNATSCRRIALKSWKRQTELNNYITFKQVHCVVTASMVISEYEQM